MLRGGRLSHHEVRGSWVEIFQKKVLKLFILEHSTRSAYSMHAGNCQVRKCYYSLIAICLLLYGSAGIAAYILLQQCLAKCISGHIISPPNSALAIVAISVTLSLLETDKQLVGKQRTPKRSSCKRHRLCVEGGQKVAVARR